LSTTGALRRAAARATRPETTWCQAASEVVAWHEDRVRLDGLLSHELATVSLRFRHRARSFRSLVDCDALGARASLYEVTVEVDGGTCSAIRIVRSFDLECRHSRRVAHLVRSDGRPELPGAN
jgi:hypothetical protein